MQVGSFPRTGSVAGGSHAIRTVGVDKNDRGSQSLGSHWGIYAMMRSICIKFYLM